MNTLRPCKGLMGILTRFTRNRLFSTDIYEPPYLEAMKPKIPIYDGINIQISGYDYSILESFQKLIYNISKNMDINVEDCWALPHVDMQISTYKPLSEILQTQYNLKIYKRVVYITEISTTQLPILMRAIEASTPAGVTIQIEEHAVHHEEERYISDKELANLKQELEDIGGPRKIK